MSRPMPTSAALIIGPSAAVVLGASMIAAPTMAAIVVAVIGFVMLAGLITRMVGSAPEDARIVRRWTIGTYWAHLAIGVAIEAIPGAIGYLGGDSNTYHRYASDILNHWTDGTALPSVIGAGKSGYGYALAGLYWFFGSERIVGLALNAAASASLIPLMDDTTRRLFGRRATPPVRWILALQPGFLIWTSQLLREAAILFLLAVALNATVRCMTAITTTRILVLGASIGALLTVRANVALLAAAGLVAALVLSQRNPVRAVGTGIAAVGALAAVVLVAGLGLAGYQATSSASLEDVQRSRADSSRSAASGFSTEADVSETSRALSFLPIGLAKTTLGPFPWDVGGSRELPGLLETLTIWCLLPSFVRGLRRARAGPERRRVWVLLLPAISVASGLALLVGNFGTTVRQRPQVLLFLLPLIGLGWAKDRRQVRVGLEQEARVRRRPRAYPVAG